MQQKPKNRETPAILVTEPAYFASVLGRLRKIGRVLLGKPGRRDLARRLPLAHAAVIRVETILDRSILLRAKKLKLIASATTGINHIDVGTARNMGTRVIHLHGTHTEPTSEHTLALMLALARKIPQVQEQMKRGGWDRARWIGRRLSGKTLGIVGIGRIGRRVAKLAGAFGMKILAYDPYVQSARGVQMCARLDQVLRQADIVSIHAALTASSRGLIGRRELGLFKRGSFLINTARGKIVDEKALLKTLKSGRIAGAALDVYSTEPLPAASPLRAHARRRANLLLTPHLGASTREAVERAAAEMAAGVERFFSRKFLPREVRG